MKFCPECGNNIEGQKFCSECGFRVEGSSPVEEVVEVVEDTNNEKEILKFSTYLFGIDDQKVNLGGKFDLSIPRMNYILTDERLIIENQKLVTKKRDDIDLHLIRDVVLQQKMREKLMKVGDLKIISVDESTPIFIIKRIHEPEKIREHIRKAMRQAKKDIGVTYRQEL